ncbi:MAG: hypothetical protein CMO60_00350, partial [Verrucomicrobiales bacterium]|nr:hypothetical protein [Verrucomicrobiales bacterium]
GEQADLDGDGRGDLCDADVDGDGLNNGEEVLLGTDPRLIDSDDDGLDDLFEQRGQTNPLAEDSDGDGQRDDVEVGPDLNAPLDTDDDGLWDAVESDARDSDGDNAHDEIDGPGPLGDLDGDTVLNGRRERGECVDVNGCDNCFAVANGDQIDTDDDGQGDACDRDDDNDGRDDALDNCPLTANVDQSDLNRDGTGDACDDDIDGDGLINTREDALGSNPLRRDSDGDGVEDGDGNERLDSLDNCINVVNPEQTDTDGDGLGDACDDDDDNDGEPDDTDNCPFIANSDANDSQLNTDGDGFGNACDLDDDNDGIDDVRDNCPLFINVVQFDLDEDGLGDACDLDDDNDGIPDALDNCPFEPNEDQSDQDGDDVGDACTDDRDGDGIEDGRDNCRDIFNPAQNDFDSDGLGNACDDDLDGDGLIGANPNGLVDEDNCDSVYNPTQIDTDLDGLGDHCDNDDDQDGLPDLVDSCPLVGNDNLDLDLDNIDAACDNCDGVFNPYQVNLDGDALGDVCDPDLDNDGFLNEQDNCPRVPNLDQRDSDGDGSGDACSTLFINHLSDRRMTGISRSGNSIWYSSHGGVTHWRYNDATEEWSGQRFTSANGLGSNIAHAIAMDQRGHPIVQTDRGLRMYVVDAGVWVVVDHEVDDCASTVDGIALDIDQNSDRLYVATSDALLIRDGLSWTCYPRGFGIPDGPIQHVKVDPRGAAWVFTSLGLGVLRLDGSWSRFSTLTGLPSNDVESVTFQVRDETLVAWVSTSSGIVRIDDYNAVVRNPNDLDDVRLPEANEVGQLIAPDGRAWMATQDGLQGEALEVVSHFGLPSARPVRFLTDQSGEPIFIVDAIGYQHTGGGVFAERDGDWTGINGLAYDSLNELTWTARDDGVLRSDGAQFGRLDGLSEEQTFDVIIDGFNHVWVSTVSNGLNQLLPDRIRRFDFGHPKRNARAKLVLDQTGFVWAAAEFGLYWFNGQQFNAIEGLRSQLTKDVAVDRRNRIWVATERGLSKGQRNRKFEHIALPTDEALGFGPKLTSVAAGGDGRILVGSLREGLYVIHPDGHIDSFRPNNELNQDIIAPSIQAVWASSNRSRSAYWIATPEGLIEYIAPSRNLVGSVCGDGVVAETEECEPINGEDSELCNADCTLARCGDGYVNPETGEECDTPGAFGEGPGQCRPNCRLSGCGDKIVDDDEECDGQEFCMDDCRWAPCFHADTGCPDFEFARLEGGVYRRGGLDPVSGPVHLVKIRSFDLQKNEVTVSQYSSCVTAGACSPAICPAHLAPKNYENNRSDHPVNCVDWHQAVAFSNWVGARLPSEAEWEYAARSGGQEIDYPWGDAAPTCEQAQVGRRDGDPLMLFDPDPRFFPCGLDTVVVCSKPAGLSVHGVCDLVGNVLEWTLDHQNLTYEARDETPFYSDERPPSEGFHMARGSSFYDVGFYVLPTVRKFWGGADGGFIWGDLEADLGFRLVRPVRP